MNIQTESRSRRRSFGTVALRGAIFTSMFAATTCAVNPATGEREISLVSEGQEIEMGRSSDPAATAQFGGLYPDAELQSYVSGLGDRLAAESERPDLPWSFKLVNHDLINAFALPGGFIYITRGILSHMNSEAELAAVLGHEIGHVTARHSAQQITRQQIGMIGLIGGALLSETVRDNAGLAMQGMQLLFLKHGRDAEQEADALGFRYMTRTHHHPEGISEIMRTLESAGGASDSGIPSWLASHPDPGDRVEANERRIAESAEDFAGYELGAERLLEGLDGLVFGEDPRDGFFDDDRFVHPTLRFELTFPAGWMVANTPEAVLSASEERDAALELTLAQEPTPSAALEAFSTVEGVSVTGNERVKLNGLEAHAADFVVTAAEQPLAGKVLFVAHDDRVYQLIGYGVQARWDARQRAVTSAMGTFEALGSNEFRDVEPARIKIVRLERAMTGQEFLRAYPSTIPDGDVLLANRVGASEQLEKGRLMKQVTGGTGPGR